MIELDRGPDLSTTKLVTLIILASLSASEIRAESPVVGAMAGSARTEAPLSAKMTGTASEDSSEANPGVRPTPKARAREARANLELGLKYKKAGDSGRALIEFLKATREDPKLIEAYYEQALIFREKGFHKLAVSRLEQALAIKAQYQKARLLLATIKLEQGKVSDAVEQLGATLGLLPKSEATAIKPDEDSSNDGIAPMILQSLHTAMPLPTVPVKAAKRLKPNKSTAEQSEGAQPSKEARRRAKSRPAGSRRSTNRRKIRELIARKYRKPNSVDKQQRSSWIARILAWPEPFKQNPQPVQVATGPIDDDEDVQPTIGSNLRGEFTSDDDVVDRTEDRTEDRPARNWTSGKTLLAYNGDLEDTRDLTDNKTFATPAAEPKQEKRIVSTTAETPPSAETPARAKSNDSFAMPQRQWKLASRSWFDAETPARTEDLEKKVAKSEINAAPRPAPTQLPSAVAEDEWTRRLKYLSEHGTSSLKPGEAFMFSEDTGEAVLFLADGQRIRRVIAAPLDTQEVLKLRRPDVLVPKELFYNTSLLGKVVAPPSPPLAIPPVTPPQVRPPAPPSSLAPLSEPPGFKIEQMMENPSGFWNWFKGLVNL